MLSIAVGGYLMHAVGNFTMIPGDLGDARFNSVILEHVYQWLTRQVADLWNPTFFYPFERVLGLSDNHFGSHWVYSILRFFGFSREIAYSGWYLFGYILNFFVCWWAMRRAGFSIVAAAAGAFVFAFGLPMLHQEGHAQLVYRFAIPLAFFAWYEFLQKRELRSLAQTNFWWSVQFLCSIYLGVFLLFCLAAVFVAYVLIVNFSVTQIDHSSLQRRSVLSWLTRSVSLFRTDWRVTSWCLASVVGMGLVSWMLILYKAIARDYQLARRLEDLYPLIPTLSSYLLADNSPLTSWIGSFMATFPTRAEHQMFVGIGALVIGLLGAVAFGWSSNDRQRLKVNQVSVGGLAELQLKNLVRVSFIALVFLVLLTLRIGDYSLYFLVLKIPGSDAIRAVSRIILVMLLPIAILVAAGFEFVVRLTATRGPVIVGVSVLFATLLLTTESYFYVPHHAAMQTWLDRQRGLDFTIKDKLSSDEILFVTQKSQEPFYITELDAMIYAQDRHLRTLNGYSGSTPPGYEYPSPCSAHDARLQGYFVYRNSPEVRRKDLLEKLRWIPLEACQK